MKKDIMSEDMPTCAGRTQALPGSAKHTLEHYSIPQTMQSPGRYGRLKYDLPSMRVRSPLQLHAQALDELAAAMVDDAGDEGDNPEILAGFTFFGQFVDHDIAFDSSPLPDGGTDPKAVFNHRTPKLDLDSLYGRGPAASPYLYRRENRAKFLLGAAAAGRDLEDKPVTLLDGRHYDLPRNSEGFALIGDPRNDENLIVSQLHLAFLKFHNAVADEICSNRAKQLHEFWEIRRTVTWHYQWMVLHDLVKRVADPAVVDDVLKRGRRMYLFVSQPFIPVEFSAAAYRFGHSMVRESYDYNRFLGSGPDCLSPATLELLFFLTGPKKERSVGKAGTLISTPLPATCIIDWRRFLDVGDCVSRNASRLINARLSRSMHRLPAEKVPDEVISLPLRNLRRGQALALPSGQALAAQYRLPVLETRRIAESGADGEVAARRGLLKETPLWYYLLKEAELMANGRHLGPLGSQIVAEVFVGLLEGDPDSFLAKQRDWKPELPSASPGDFRLRDMIRFLDAREPIINPLG